MNILKALALPCLATVPFLCLKINIYNNVKIAQNISKNVIINYITI
jgi:hypothetical protein